MTQDIGIDPASGAVDELPRVGGAAPLHAVLRAQPEDFVVEELLAQEADGAGEHAWLWVEKRGANTEWVARRLAQFAGVPAAAVGYAGLKDRHAITRQAYSVQLAGKPAPDWSRLDVPGVSVLAATRHARKLKRGALRGNRFSLVLRDVMGDRATADALLGDMETRGVPNYFGEQRFGRAGDNVEQARAMFAGQRVERHVRGLLLSAARSEIFNAVLAERVRDGSWDAALDGEIWALAGSHSWFGPEPWAPELASRLASGDISTSGPLWGEGEPPTTGAAAALEARVAARYGDLIAGLAAARLKQERRALRLLPRSLHWRWRDAATLELAFELPPGCYATVVLRALVA